MNTNNKNTNNINNNNNGTNKKITYVAGIDLGTTNTVLYAWQDTNPHPSNIKVSDQKYLIPSIVYFNDKNRNDNNNESKTMSINEYDNNLEIITGYNAVQYLQINPKNTVYESKRLIGQKLSIIL